MSAVEKLKALEPWLAKGSSREVVALVDALPQIVAVVEAAENVYAVGPWSEERLGRLDDLAAALGALDEVLT